MVVSDRKYLKADINLIKLDNELTDRKMLNVY